jgi:hypothetical protein
MAAIRTGRLGMLLACASAAFSLFSAADRAGLRAQEAALQLDPVVLSSAEQVEVLKGKIILRDIPDSGLNGRTYEAIGTLPGSLDDALAVLLDYRHYQEFMPRVERSVVTDESPTVAVVEQHLKLPLGMGRRYRLRYTVRRAADGFRIDWLKIPWPEVPSSRSVVDTSGHWQVGRFGDGGLLAVYHVYTEPGRVPLGMKGLALSLSRRDIPKVIEKVRERILSVAAPPPIKD